MSSLLWFSLSLPRQTHKEHTMASSSSPSESSSKAQQKDAKTLAAERLAAALRDNLRRRKQFARARAQMAESDVQASMVGVLDFLDSSSPAPLSDESKSENAKS